MVPDNLPESGHFIDSFNFRDKSLPALFLGLSDCILVEPPLLLMLCFELNTGWIGMVLLEVFFFF